MKYTSNNILYQNAMDAFLCGTLKEFIKSLNDEEVKELKYYVLSHNLKLNRPLVGEIEEYQLKRNGTPYERYNKNTMQ